MIKEPYDAFKGQGFFITYNPPGDGNCQFSAICRILNQLGFQLSPETLRREIVPYLESNPMDVEGFSLGMYLDVSLSKYLENMSNDGTYGDKITLRAAAELFNTEFVLVSTLGIAAEVTISPRYFSLQSRALLEHFAKNQGEDYVVLDQIDDSESSEKVLPTLDRSGDFEVSTTIPCKLFGDLPPELTERILLTAIRDCVYVSPSHVVYTFNALRSVRKFWRIVLDAKVMKYLPQVYFSHPDILPNPKGPVVQVNMQRIIRNTGSFSGLLIDMKKILNSEKGNRAWLDLILLTHEWHIIINVWWKTKK